MVVVNPISKFECDLPLREFGCVAPRLRSIVDEQGRFSEPGTGIFLCAISLGNEIVQPCHIRSLV